MLRIYSIPTYLIISKSLYNHIIMIPLKNYYKLFKNGIYSYINNNIPLCIPIEIKSERFLRILKVGKDNQFFYLVKRQSL